MASEVRKLALRSSDSAGQITELIREIRAEMKEASASMSTGLTEADKGMNVVQHTDASFKQIFASSEEAKAQIERIASFIAELEAGSHHIAAMSGMLAERSQGISSDIRQIAESSAAQTGSVQQMAHSAEALSLLSSELESEVGKFSIRPSA